MPTTPTAYQTTMHYVARAAEIGKTAVVVAAPLGLIPSPWKVPVEAAVWFPVRYGVYSAHQLMHDNFFPDSPMHRYVDRYFDKSPAIYEHPASMHDIRTQASIVTNLVLAGGLYLGAAVAAVGLHKLQRFAEAEAAPGYAPQGTSTERMNSRVAELA